MLREDTSSSLCQQLSRQDQLRTACECSYQRDKPQKKGPTFAALRSWDNNDLKEVHHLKWDSVIVSGMLMLEEGNNESTIQTV